MLEKRLALEVFVRRMSGHRHRRELKDDVVKRLSCDPEVNRRRIRFMFALLEPPHHSSTVGPRRRPIINVGTGQLVGTDS